MDSIGDLKGEQEHLSPQLADAIPFSLSKPDPLNTVISRTEGLLVFRISTPSKLLKTDVTTITREEPGKERVIATVRWHHYEPDRIELDFGDEIRNVRLKDFFPSDGDFEVRARSFKVKEQSFEWRWRFDAPHFELIDPHGTQLAVDCRRRIGMFVPDFVTVSLSVAPAAMDIIDYIVLTYVCIEQERRQAAASRRDPAAAATVLAFK